MEKLSRVKKYEDLRKSIETDNNIDNASQLQNAAQKETLRKIDSSIFKRIEIQDDDAYTPTREKKLAGMEEQPPVDDTFTNEYLDDFIKEVREYNIRKGTRESDNTQADILYQLNAANRAKRSHYIQEIQEDDADVKKTVISRDDIAMQVQNLLKEEEDAEPYTTTPIDPFGFNLTPSLDDEIKEENEGKHIEKSSYHTESDSYQTTKEEPQKSYQHVAAEEPAHTVYAESTARTFQDDLSEEAPAAENVVETVDEQEETPAGLHNQLLEETQQLRVQMGEYEDELTDLSDGMKKTNKLLNFVLCFLILVLLVIIGFIGYSLWKARGI